MRKKARAADGFGIRAGIPSECRATAQWLLKHLMTPQPFVPKYLFEAQFCEPIETAEVLHDVLRSILVLFGSETPVTYPPGFRQRCSKSHGPHGSTRCSNTSIAVMKSNTAAAHRFLRWTNPASSPALIEAIFAKRQSTLLISAKTTLKPWRRKRRARTRLRSRNRDKSCNRR